METEYAMMEKAADFETQYIGIRDKEHRIYTDGELLLLPDVPLNHIHHNEWQIRKASAQKLYSYLEQKNKPLNILEVGCGNGWLAAYLAHMPNAIVTGTDINNTELEQAKRVFSGNNPDFILGDIRKRIVAANTFDIVIFAASVQYFSSLRDIVSMALSLLKPGGEIHILDTIFYEAAEVRNAQERSKAYFSSLGHPGLSEYYFHHSLAGLKGIDYKVLYNPTSFSNRLFKNKNPFYWVRISKEK